MLKYFLLWHLMCKCNPYLPWKYPYSPSTKKSVYKNRQKRGIVIYSLSFIKSVLASPERTFIIYQINLTQVSPLSSPLCASFFTEILLLGQGHFEVRQMRSWCESKRPHIYKYCIHTHSLSPLHSGLLVVISPSCKFLQSSSNLQRSSSSIFPPIHVSCWKKPLAVGM